MLGLQVETDDGELFAAPITDIATVTPLLAPDQMKVIECVAQALRCPPDTRDGQIWLSAIVDAHHYVEVSVALRRQPCSPPYGPALVDDRTATRQFPAPDEESA
jgi:hypothetical protein